MVLDNSLLNTQQYKVRIKVKVEQSRERSSELPLHLGVVATEKGTFWSPSTTVANFTDSSFESIDTFFFTSMDVKEIFLLASITKS